jgi:hypothetical protein
MAFLPDRYDDPLYQRFAHKYEGQYGLPTGILDAIRLAGERSNASQVSEAGARSVYQITPPTARGIQRNYGFNPLTDADAATHGAAALMAENIARTHDPIKAVQQYHGGLNPKNYGPRTRAYVDRVRSYLGKNDMALGPSLYPEPYYGGVDPLAPEPIKQPVPIPNDPGPSVSTASASPIATHKRGGILGGIGRILENVFMPEPDSRYAAALRGGIWDAKANQAAYKAEATKQATDNAMAQAKLKNLLTKGEYQIAGNNVIHFPPDGGAPEVITPPATPSEHERLIDRWSKMDDADPAKELIHQMLLGQGAPEVLQSRERQAATRAAATTSSARIRASTKPSAASKPPAGFILDQ